MSVVGDRPGLSAWRLAATASAFIAAVLAYGSTAREAPPDALVDRSALSSPAATLADRPITEAVAGVFFAESVGSVRVDKAIDLSGPRVNPIRLQVAGSTAAIVSVSSARPVPSVDRGGFQAPLSFATVTSRYGVARLRADGGSRMHVGVDLSAPQGSPVAASLDGRVSSARWAGGYGLLVVLDHGNGLQTRYAHLSRIAVTPGQSVRKGELVGLVGSTGRSTGPHLHYEVRQNGQPVNPLRY